MGFNAGTGAGAVGASFATDAAELGSGAGGDLTVTPAPATLGLGGLVFTYDGAPHAAGVSTSPAGLDGVTITYSRDNAAVATPIGAGSYAVVAALNNANFTAASATGTLVINPAKPTLTWADPADIAQGAALGTAQLDATTPVPGTYTYTPAAGTVLNAGAGQVLSVTFTPADAADFLPAGAQVLINVVAPTPPPVPLVTVQGVQLARLRKAKHETTTVIDVQFSDAIDSTAAQDLGNFTLVSAGKDKNLGTGDDRPLALALASYDAGSHTVTLTPRKPLVLNPSLQLNVIAAGLTDRLGRPIDGNHDGQPGGDAFATLSKQGISIARVEAAGGVATPGSISAAAVDTLLVKGLTVASRHRRTHGRR